MTCYREGGCGPYEQTPCCECPASHPEYATMGEVELSKVEAAPAQPGSVTIGHTPSVDLTGEYIKKDRVIALVQEHLAEHGPGDYVRLCPMCGKVAFWSSHFKGWRCTDCDYVRKPELHESSVESISIIQAIKAEPGLKFRFGPK